LVSSLLSSVGRCTFRTISSHQQPLSIHVYSLSLTNSTLVTRAVESESEGILGGVRVRRNF
jgi:hypothetical protein